MPRPSPDKFVYNLSSLPSTCTGLDSKQDNKIFQQKYIALVRRHKYWMRKSLNPHHLAPCTIYPLTSGELSIIELRRQVL